MEKFSRYLSADISAGISAYSIGRLDYRSYSTHRKWREIKLQPGTAGTGNMLGCSLISFHFLLAILCPEAVSNSIYWVRLKGFYAVGRFTANISENSKQADSERLSGQRREVQNLPSLLDQLSTEKCRLFYPDIPPPQ